MVTHTQFISFQIFVDSFSRVIFSLKIHDLMVVAHNAIIRDRFDQLGLVIRYSRRKIHAIESAE